MPTLSIFFPESFPDKSVAGHTYRLEVPRPDSDSSEYTIGRGAEMEINLRVKTISRRHAVIGYSYAADTWSTQDLGSAGGTWLNDQRLPPYTWAKIQIGDKLRLGPNVALRIVEDDQDTIQGDDEPTFITPTKAPDPLPVRAGDRVHLGPHLINLVEDEQDTVDSGPPTIVGTAPLDHRTGETLATAPPAPKTYADTLDTALQWLINPKTRLGALVRLLVLVIAAAVFVLVQGWES